MGDGNRERVMGRLGAVIWRYWPLAVGGAVFVIGFFGILYAASTEQRYALFVAGEQASHDMPPVEFRGNARVEIQFVDSANLSSSCGGGASLKMGCRSTRDGVIYMPNPCELVEQNQRYADVLCHELGHANGWAGDHEGAVND